MNLTMKGIDKSFGTNQVLNNAAFELKDGEIHALMGENGAGKSTLMKILTGVYDKDAGEIFVDGKPVDFKNPQEAEEAGIVFIYQELNVVYDMTVEENLFLGKEIANRFGVLDREKMRKEAQDILNRMGLSIDPSTPMSELSVGQQQMIEICKALMADAKVLIMDEPTAALTESETENLFKVIENLQDQGVSIIYISHRMEEIFNLCDRITVLRDGAYVDTKAIPDTDMDGVVQMMIGREIGERYPKRDHTLGEEVLRVEGLASNDTFKDVNFTVHAGEVLGVAGLMGAGRTEIMQTLFGARPRTAGKVYIKGKQVNIHTPAQAIEDGIAFLTEDRKTEGLLLDKSISENIELAILDRIANRGVLSPSDSKALVAKSIKDFGVKCSGPQQEAGSLSGGNQQKVILAKWVYTAPQILILDEPTRGVDIGAKKEIYNMINKLASKGVAIIMVSSELPEVLGMSDNIMVVHEGKVTGIVPGETADQTKIMTLATGGTL